MTGVKNRKYRTEGCGKWPSLGVAGTKTAEYCSQQASKGALDVKNRKYITEGCGKTPSFEVAGRKTSEYGSPFAPEGVVDACRQCRTGRCGKKASFGVENTRMAQHGAQHARLKYCVGGYREKEVGQHHSGKETVGNVSPSDGKHTTVHPPPTQASPPSDGSRGSRKRVRHPETTSTASKRATARESTGGAVAMPDIDGRQTPVKRYSTMKTEVQLSL
ncbi:unnamed protein product [Ascophyllum nodosum]